MNDRRKRVLQGKLEEILAGRREVYYRLNAPGSYHGLRLREEMEALEWAINLAKESRREPA